MKKKGFSEDMVVGEDKESDGDKSRFVESDGDGADQWSTGPITC